MKGVRNTVIEDLRQVNHLVIVLQDLVQDKQAKTIIRDLKTILGGYVNE